MTQIDCKVDLIMLLDVYQALLILHVHCHKFIADLWSMLSVVDQAELLGFDVKLQFWISV